MKRPPCLDTKLVPGAFLLAGLLALAPTAPAANNMRPRGASSGPSFGRQTQSGSASGTAMRGIAVDHAGGNGVRRADTGKSGSNPMYEGRGQTSLKPGAGTSSGQPYRDPEDMTARYRPRNNKTTRSANDAAAQGADAAQPQSTPKKHIAGVKYEDRVAGNTPGGTAGHATHDVVQSKDSAVIGMNETVDRNSAHATETLRTSSNAKAGDNPLYQDSGKSGTNPMYEPGRMQSAGTNGNPRPSAPVQRPK